MTHEAETRALKDSGCWDGQTQNVEQQMCYQGKETKDASAKADTKEPSGMDGQMFFVFVFGRTKRLAGS